MKKSRLRIPLDLPATRDQAEAVMTELADLVNTQRTVVAERDAQVLTINKEYEAQLGRLEAGIAQRTDSLRAWAESNPSEFAKGRKSIEMVSGILGFRTDTPKLSLLNRSWSWEKVLEAIKRFRITDWIRTKEEVDKELILTNYSAAKSQADWPEKVLAPCGLKVVQSESFFVEPKLTELESRQVQSTAAA